MLMVNCPKCERELDENDYIQKGEITIAITCRLCKKEKNQALYKVKARERELKKAELIMEHYAKESSFK